MTARALTALTSAALLVALAGCSSDAPPTDASVDAYCDAYTEWALTTEGTDWEAYSEAAGRLVEVGTPEGTPDAERHAVELFADWVRSEAPGERLSIAQWAPEEDRAGIYGLMDWSQVTCVTGEVAETGANPLGR
ncbi:hypothetical protein [Sanguibacter suaedae]|uniref:Lipoprotein n=1 Tax=Sanguibacter suaedae TaxID=2795737 RepID=A0A934M7Q6_9MICO|nr:hypothetical protein [Sanguibacter suaedae]MBI9115677.1 hypothetical protein [Sanguibacter suaedae]